MTNTDSKTSKTDKAWLDGYFIGEESGKKEALLKITQKFVEAVFENGFMEDKNAK